MDAKLIILILVLTTFDVTSGTKGCPQRCRCRTRRVSKLGQTFFVNCKNRGLRSVPDLSALKASGLPKRLDLSGNRIRTISRDDFQTGLNIAMLFLESNENVILEDEAFSNLADSLQFLGLQSIHLQFVKPFTFLKGLDKLEKIILSYNNQKDDGFISGKLFSGLGLFSLKEISMYNCHISGMEKGMFEGIEHLEVLDLTFNWLKDIPPALRGLTGLKKIHLKLNNIKDIERGSFKGMRSLTDIDLNDNNGLNIISGSFEGLEDILSSLYIRNCELDDVPYEGLRSLRALKHLNVGFNPLVSLSAKSLEGQYCLETLDISMTLFPLLPEVLEPQKNCIITLILNDRSLTGIPREFLSVLTKLNHVSLNKNRISVLKAGSLRGVKARGYDLSNNPLRRIEPGVFKDTQPGITLTLKQTNITDLHFMLEYPKKTFQQLYLEGSNVTCDCSVYEAMQLGEPWTLDGACYQNKVEKDLKDTIFKTFLRDNCTDPVEESKYNVKEVVQEGGETEDSADTGGGFASTSSPVLLALCFFFLLLRL